MHTDLSRSILEIAGDDRLSFLQGIITQDTAKLNPGHGIFTALLSPQGKILHDFFLITHGDAILLDCDATQKETLFKRLTMYKLRAKVTITDQSDAWQIAYRTRAEFSDIGHLSHKKHLLLLTDPRAAELGERLYIAAGQLTPKDTALMDEYHRHRILLGVPDGAHDISEDTPLDGGYDLLNAVSFTKGCYVGQEVTARMHYKNIARRGFYMVQSPSTLPAFGTAITALEKPIGQLRGSQGALGLAMLKFEETQAALESGAPILVDNIALTVTSPTWMHAKLALFRAARENQ
jgi:folate-binding protein YgfZ